MFDFWVLACHSKKNIYKLRMMVPCALFLGPFSHCLCPDQHQFGAEIKLNDILKEKLIKKEQELVFHHSHFQYLFNLVNNLLFEL